MMLEEIGTRGIVEYAGANELLDFIGVAAIWEYFGVELMDELTVNQLTKYLGERNEQEKM